MDNIEAIIATIIRELNLCIQSYRYEFPNLYLYIGKQCLIIHIVETEVESPLYCLVSEDSIQLYERDFIISVHKTKYGCSILGCCEESDLEFSDQWNQPCYQIPINKLKEIKTLKQTITYRQINTINTKYNIAIGKNRNAIYKN